MAHHLCEVYHCFGTYSMTDCTELHNILFVYNYSHHRVTMLYSGMGHLKEEEFNVSLSDCVDITDCVELNCTTFSLYIIIVTNVWQCCTVDWGT